MKVRLNVEFRAETTNSQSQAVLDSIQTVEGVLTATVGMYYEIDVAADDLIMATEILLRIRSNLRSVLTVDKVAFQLTPTQTPAEVQVGSDFSLDEVMSEHCIRVFARLGNKKQAARVLGLTRRSLYRRLTQIGLHRPVRTVRVKASRRSPSSALL